MSKRANAIKRMEKEFKDLNTQESCFSVGRDSFNAFKWNAIIQGPDASPYAGGIFRINIDFADDYPFRPPKFTFKTRIYHPNINSHGQICISILKDGYVPSLTVHGVLLSITSLLTDANPDDPLDKESARLYKADRHAFDTKARHYTHIYAK